MTQNNGQILWQTGAATHRHLHNLSMDRKGKKTVSISLHCQEEQAQGNATEHRTKQILGTCTPYILGGCFATSEIEPKTFHSAGQCSNHLALHGYLHYHFRLLPLEIKIYGSHFNCDMTKTETKLL